MRLMFGSVGVTRANVTRWGPAASPTGTIRDQRRSVEVRAPILELLLLRSQVRLMKGGSADGVAICQIRKALVKWGLQGTVLRKHPVWRT